MLRKYRIPKERKCLVTKKLKAIKGKVALSPSDRKFILNELNSKFKIFKDLSSTATESEIGWTSIASRNEGTKKGNTLDKDVQTLLYRSSPKKCLKPIKNELFWLLYHDDTDKALEELKYLTKKKPVNAHKINLLMDRTFIKRRDKILKENLNVAVVKEEYPALFSLDGMKKELCRILQDDICELFFNNIRKYCKLLVENSENSLKKDIIPYLRAAQNKQERKMIYMAKSVLLLPMLLGNVSFLMFSDQMSYPTEYPHIVAPQLKDVLFNYNTMEVVVEDVTICKNVSFMDALLLWISCYYVFNISYPDIYCNTIVTVDNLYLEEFEQPVPDKVTDFLELLESCLNNVS